MILALLFVALVGVMHRSVEETMYDPNPNRSVTRTWFEITGPVRMAHETKIDSVILHFKRIIPTEADTILMFFVREPRKPTIERIMDLYR